MRTALSSHADSPVSKRRPAVDYRRLLVPVDADPESELAVDYAARLAAEKHGTIVALAAVEVPLDFPLERPFPAEESHARAALDCAVAIGDSYGVRVVPKLVKARSLGQAVLDEAAEDGAELIVVAAEPRLQRRGGIGLSETVMQILKHAPCRVAVAAARR